LIRSASPESQVEPLTQEQIKHQLINKAYLKAGNMWRTGNIRFEVNCELHGHHTAGGGIP
jgi:hypothetical protein